MKTTPAENLHSPENAPGVRKGSRRLLFIDNIRTFLTVLVIAHHLMIIYSGSGGWIYHDNRQDEITSILGGWFCAVNQSYFMGLFLLISAYFVPGAYDRKGPGRFISDRLVRLGIPLAFYSWILRPLLIFIFSDAAGTGSIWSWYCGVYFRDYGIIGGGPLWFIEALLLFSLIYAIWRMLRKSPPAAQDGSAPFPGSLAVIASAFTLGTASFLVRLAFPVNDTFLPLNFQFANFSQYIALFILGLVAYRKKWLTAIPDRVGRLWLGIAIALITLYGPIAYFGGGTEDVEPFLGGWHWQSLIFSMWDAFLCLSMCIGLISLFRRRLDRQGGLARELSHSAYATYLIHEPVISIAAMMAAGLTLYPLVKFALAAVVLIPLCFGLGALFRRLPYADRVL
jgi:glucan biosynthesis protein C